MEAVVGTSPGLPAPTAKEGLQGGKARRDTGGQLPSVPVFGSDVGHDVLVEELQDERDAVGKDKVLGHVLKLGTKASE